MKRFMYKINRKLTVLLSILLLGVTSCDYLDVIPPAQPDFEDTMKDEASTLAFLYSAYYYVREYHPFDYEQLENASDECLQPKDWDLWEQLMLFGTLSADWDLYWFEIYSSIGYVHHFLDQFDKSNPKGVTEEDKAQYRAECAFLEAYYHFRALELFGPCPIIPSKVDPNIAKEDIPGRSHFDYCVDYIVKKLDEAATVLPAKRKTNELGRADATICKCLKARVLLYAASPLWNGSFYDDSWKNKNFETPEYGNELVSHQYDPKKWEVALQASLEALQAAEKAGYKLFDIETANDIADKEEVPLPFVPGKEENTAENILFKERVRMFQYLATAHEGNRNNEIIWGVSTTGDFYTSEKNISRMPNKIIRQSDGTWHRNSGYSGWAPTLNAVSKFYTENGELPAKDENFYPESEWYTRFYEGTSSPECTDEMDKEDVKNDIIKYNTHRESRFYAWIAFDGGEYSPIMQDGSPLWLNFKNPYTNGYTVGLRNYAGTGYLTKKFIAPDLIYYPDGTLTGTASRTPFIRLAELYLNLAECYAALDKVPESLENLNVIRRRAGIKELSSGDLTDMSLMEWVRNERFVELYQEGHRYYDVRRWCIAPDVMKPEAFYALNGMVEGPSFEEFNQPKQVDQPIKWNNRQYLVPIKNSEIYSNPQLIQAPGY